MEIMKRNFLFALLVLAFAAIPAHAGFTVEETTEADHLINSGYSKQTAEDVYMQKDRVAGKPVEPLYPKRHSGITKAYKWLWGYFDGSIDNADRLHHDIQPSPWFSDL